MLKSTWLKGKRNRRIDHIIYTLVMEMVLDYKDRHKRQKVHLEGPNLVDQHWQRILVCVKMIVRDSIQQFDDKQFHVASISGKLGASNRTDAVRRGVRRGLIAL